MTYQNSSNVNVSGIVAADGNGAFNGRTLTAGAGVSIANGDGIAGNPVISLAGGSTGIDSLTPNSGTSPVVPDAFGDVDILGTGSITTVGGSNSMTVQLTGLTQYNVLVGAGSATITKVAPSATSGVPLISQGAAADPAFGTVVVAGGGTGATTLTGVVIGNGTSAMTATAPTEHAIVIGAASSDIADVGPLTNGQLVIGSTGVAPVAASLTAPAAGLTITPGAGSVTFALANDLAALEGLASTGIGVRSAADTWVQRSIAGTASRVSVTNGDGVSGNPTIDIDAAYVGQASITTLGTVTTGTWNATAVTVPYGGTGNTTFTAYSVITAGTTATGAFQNVSGVGTSGQVLTSNGASALPTWQDAAGGGASPSLNYSNGLAVWDAVGPSGLYGGWEANSGTTMSTSTEGRFGTTNDSDMFYCRYVETGTYANVFEAIIRTPSALTSSDIIILGLTNWVTSVVSVTDGIYFRVQYAVPGAGSEVWYAVTENTSTETATSTGVSYETASWHSFRIEVNAAGTSAEFFIDGVSVATNSTNMPATGTGYAWERLHNGFAGTATSIDLLMAGMDYNGSRI